MKYEYKERRLLYPSRVKALCIAKQWYTHGTCEEYDELLIDFIGNLNNVTCDDLEDIAKNIKEHSDTEYTIPSIMFELARMCESFFDNE